MKNVRFRVRESWKGWDDEEVRREVVAFGNCVMPVDQTQPVVHDPCPAPTHDDIATRG